ncbi:AbiJ-NTD4 domain-containing protein [Gymnodinialimonas sp. 57CJ19]|uniref:AbiJ-NTD4 domain-containing protein n=1 Tax=Gymnodinialimonas sp. 57CJ19 TaxID=3138498 RepID=UPI0031344BC5
MSRRFSQRIGLISPRTSVQREDMDERLANRAWSLFLRHFIQERAYFLNEDSVSRLLFFLLWDDFFGARVDEIPETVNTTVAVIRDWYDQSKWNEKYDLIQFFSDLQHLQENSTSANELRNSSEKFTSAVNDLLQSEKSAYRFVGDTLSEITDESEIVEIESALNAPNKYSDAKAHISMALRKYSDREAPDYRNSVKESISAVESAFTAFNGEKNKNMSAALSAAEKNGLVLQPALRSGILNLYGWTSDESGVRHALLGGSDGVTEHEARLMLVLCSAFVNYVASKFQ